MNPSASLFDAELGLAGRLLEYVQANPDHRETVAADLKRALQEELPGFDAENPPPLNAIMGEFREFTVKVLRAIDRAAFGGIFGRLGRPFRAMKCASHNIKRQEGFTLVDSLAGSRNAGVCGVRWYRDMKAKVMVRRIVVKMSPHVLKAVDGPKRCNGLVVNNWFEAMVSVLCHELLHGVLFLSFKNSEELKAAEKMGNQQNHGRLFQGLAKGLFGHTDWKHSLTLAFVDEPLEKGQVLTGDAVSFNLKNEVITGTVIKACKARVHISVDDKVFKVPYAMAFSAKAEPEAEPAEPEAEPAEPEAGPKEPEAEPTEPEVEVIDLTGDPDPIVVVDLTGLNLHGNSAKRRKVIVIE